MAEVTDKPKRDKRTHTPASAVSIRPRGLPEPDAATYIGASLSTLQKLVREGKLPRPKLISDRRVVHEVSDLDAYMDACPRSDLMPVPRKAAA